MDTCPICLENINDRGFIVLQCQHKIDLKCFVSLIEMHGIDSVICPLCRARFVPENTSDTDSDSYVDIQQQETQEERESDHFY